MTGGLLGGRSTPAVWTHCMIIPLDQVAEKQTSSEERKYFVEKQIGRDN